MQNIDLVRVAIAGSVDDGKSTFIGRLLYDAGALAADQIEALTRHHEIDLAHVTDGLAAEREQGITIDVAYRMFERGRRRFILADVPGHEQYTRNMITGASTADIALILLDAQRGITSQSRRHLTISSLLGIPNIIILANKMDAVGYRESAFIDIKNQISTFAEKLRIQNLQVVPVSGLRGDMVVERGQNMSWWGGPTAVNALDNTELSTGKNLIDLRFPVQSQVRHEGKRWYLGTIASGSLKVGERIKILPSESESLIQSIQIAGREVSRASAGDAVAISLATEQDISRGNIIARPSNLPTACAEVQALMCQMSSAAIKKGRELLIKSGSFESRCTIAEIEYELDVDSLHRRQSDALHLNAIGKIRITIHAPMHADLYNLNKKTGAFILIDEVNAETVAAGMIVAMHQKHPSSSHLERSGEISPQARDGKGNAPIIWLTGLSGSGKTTVANALISEITARNHAVQSLDGDVLRGMFGNDLGFTREDRAKNLQRATSIAQMLSRHGIIVIASFISPYRADRAIIRSALSPFIEVFVDAPIDICEARDVKGLYKKARSGEIKNFTGISDPYEAPQNSEIHVQTDTLSLPECTQKITNYLESHGHLSSHPNR